MRKKRVLFVAEAHYLNSGFGTYCWEVLSRIAATGKYELAEFACWGDYSKARNVPWKYYANCPEKHEPKEVHDLFGSNPINNFGYWRFDRVVLDFKPDIIITYRDPWMDLYLDKSFLRPYFHWAWMPTVDSAPQKTEWIDVYNRCDAIFAYSEYGIKTVNNQSTKANTIGCASPASNREYFKPLDKSSVRAKMQLSDDSIIIGTVMRNQRRKLFPELMKAFRKFLDIAPKEVSNRSFLYLHTMYPEPQGWPLVDHAIDYGLINKVLTTYICRNCQYFFANHLSDAMTFCPNCKQRSAGMPGVGFGLDHKDLHMVYNCMDLYVQYAICEGFGIPQLEALDCGVPLAAVDYSAMEDVIKNSNSIPIPVAKTYRELDTGAERVYPDNDAFAEQMKNFFMKPEPVRKRIGLKNMKKAQERYSYDDTAKVWMDYIDEYKPVGLQGKWDAPPRQFGFRREEDPNWNNEQYIHWLFESVGAPEKALGYEGLERLKNLNLGANTQFGNMQKVDKESYRNEFNNMIQHARATEQARLNPHLPQPWYIQEANRRYIQR